MLALAMYIFMFFVLISFAFGTHREPHFQWNMGLKFALPLTPNLKFVLPPMPTPDASQWNIGGVGPSGVGAGVGHVHFIFFV